MASLMIAAKSPKPNLNQTVALYQTLNGIISSDNRINLGEAVMTMAMHPTPITLGEAYLRQIYKFYDFHKDDDTGKISVERTVTRQWSGQSVIDSDDAGISTVTSFLGDKEQRFWIIPNSTPHNFVEKLRLGNHSSIDQVGVAVDLADPKHTRDTESYKNGIKASMEFGADVMIDRIVRTYRDDDTLPDLDNEQINALQSRVLSIIEDKLSADSSLSEKRSLILKEITELLKQNFPELDIPSYANVTSERILSGNGSQSLPPPSSDMTRLMRDRGLIPLGHVAHEGDVTFTSGINHPWFGGSYSAPNVNMDWKDATYFLSHVSFKEVYMSPR